MTEEQATFTGFAGHKRVATGDLVDVALELQALSDREASVPLVLIDDATGRAVSVSLHGTPQQLRARLERLVAASAPRGEDEPPRKQGRGRPKLGVVSREVTLLPRHWDWLAMQPGGASVALRKLVEQARRDGAARDRARAARDAAYCFMYELAGDLPAYEEAIRALFAGDAARLAGHVRTWPKDVRAHAVRLADKAFQLAREAEGGADPA